MSEPFVFLKHALVRSRVMLVPAVVAACLATVSCTSDRSMEYPRSWPQRLLGVHIVRATLDDVAVPKDVAVWQVRRTLFLTAGPAGEPYIFPIRATGTIAKGYRPPGESEPTQGTVLELDDQAALLVVWLDVTRADIAPPGVDTSGMTMEGSIDVVALVDGDLGDVLSVRFLSGESGLPEPE